MEDDELSGVELDPSGQVKSLNPGILNAVGILIANCTGGKSGDGAEIYAGDENNCKDADPAQLAMALAYAQLCIDEPEMVTSRHLKMLRKNFSYEQILELNTFIKKMIE